jgi:tetratricopeptide (TPR) repeat protein
MIFVIACTMISDASQDEQAQNSFRALQLGYVALDAGDFDGAMHHYQRALDLAETREHRFNALLGYGSAAYELGRYDQARQVLEQAHAIKPEDAETTFTLGVVCRRLGELETALTYLSEAAVRDPTSIPALVEMGIAYGELERHEDAERVCRRALALDEGNIEARLGLAVALYHQDKNDQAAAVFREVLEAEPDNVRAHFGLGLALLFSGDREGAIREVVFLNKHSRELADELHEWIFPDD